MYCITDFKNKLKTENFIKWFAVPTGPDARGSWTSPGGPRHGDSRNPGTLTQRSQPRPGFAHPLGPVNRGTLTHWVIVPGAILGAAEP